MSSTKFQRKKHRARRLMEAVGHAYPDAWRDFDGFRQARGKSPDFDWPNWCYMPIAGGLASVSRKMGLTLQAAKDAAIVSALGAWRMTQGIYRFDPTLLKALLETPLEGAIPVEHLCHLPEWCVYVELEQLGVKGLYGAWIHMECDVARNGQPEFRALLDLAADPRQPFAKFGGLEPFRLPLKGTVESSWRNLADSAAEQAKKMGKEATNDLMVAQAKMQAEISLPLLSVALYLCADPDLMRRGVSMRPERPSPVKTNRRGWVIHPAQGPLEWDVGTRIGAALRAADPAKQECGENTGRQVRPHVRRAHWHTFLSGRRKESDGSIIPAENRKKDLRWIPPIPVNVESLDRMASTIKPVSPY